ncbi:MAG TPA: transcriptional regulator, partial [Actinomycetes bacterium]|nr:transcriptional regulator [Actinomycetes bacterium]
MSAFQVIAEPHRRHILDLLREGERSVNELVLGLVLS